MQKNIFTVCNKLPKKLELDLNVHKFKQTELLIQISVLIVLKLNTKYNLLSHECILISRWNWY